MNQNKPFYIALVVATCVLMVVCGFVINFAWSMRSEVSMAKSNIVNERQYSIEQIKKASNELSTKQKEIQVAGASLEQHKVELVEIQNELKQTIKEYELARNSAPESVQKDENNARAFLVIWQSSLEDEDEPVYMMSKKDVESSSEDGVSFYHTLSRVFTPAGLIAYAKRKDKGITTVAAALKHSRRDGEMIVIPLY